MKNWNEKKELYKLCENVRGLVIEEKWSESEQKICWAMQQYPDAAQPHNLYGILLEKMGNHLGAMKHFRAAWALDPTYMPARFNLEQYSSFFSKGNCAFIEADCREQKQALI